MNAIKSVGLGLALSSVCAASFAANILTNGNFDSGNTGFASDYVYSPGNIYNDSTYDVVSDPFNSHSGAASFGDHTSGSGLMLAVNGSTTANLVVWRQTVSVLSGTMYEFGGWATSWGGGAAFDYLDPAPAAFRISINGVDLGPAVQLSGANGVWSEFSFLWESANATSALIELRLTTTAYVGNDPAFDDFQFAAAIPEPTALALLGIALPGLALLRRRKLDPAGCCAAPPLRSLAFGTDTRMPMYATTTPRLTQADHD